MRNPLTEITGPEFLIFFAVLNTAVAVFCWLLRRARDKSMEGVRAEITGSVDADTG
jgi:hypothetical protein